MIDIPVMKTTEEIVIYSQLFITLYQLIHYVGKYFNYI